MNLFHRFYDFFEHFRLADGEFGEDFAVEFDLVLLEHGHKPAVGEAVLPGGGVDAHLPELAEIALALMPAAGGMQSGVHHALERGTVIGLAVALETFGALDYFFLPGSFENASFYSCHK